MPLTCSIKPVTEKGTNICGSMGGCKAYIDTGTSYIRVPNDLVDDLNSELKAFPTPSGMVCLWKFVHNEIHTHLIFIAFLYIHSGLSIAPMSTSIQMLLLSSVENSLS